MDCFQCGDELSQKDKFCPSCGYPINKNSEIVTDNAKNSSQENTVSKSSMYFGLAMILIWYVAFYNIGLEVSYIDLAGMECQSSDYDSTGFTDFDETLSDFDNDITQWCKQKVKL
ncbi:MAG: zinc-ribbon domain-containing protein [Candidatus Poseidoniales archaeon]|nr:zinc-ribbon domain-containing protein [Candidatus Poseidoniales archaeon]